MSGEPPFLTGPVPPYSNPPIEPQFYQPSRFVISAVTTGQTTTITTTEDMNYVIGQLVRLLIPSGCGSIQLNEQSGYVISIPGANQVTLNIDSRNSDTFIANPYVASITNATQSNPCVLTANNGFRRGMSVYIQNVGGMTQLNNQNFVVAGATPTTISLSVNSSSFSAYTSGGTASLIGVSQTLPQILGIGDANSGQISSNGRTQISTNIPGSFINIS